jgi:hypothetical protein
MCSCVVARLAEQPCTEVIELVSISIWINIFSKNRIRWKAAAYVVSYRGRRLSRAVESKLLVTTSGRASAHRM